MNLKEMMQYWDKEIRMSANDMQVGGSHYAGKKIQPWDAMESMKLSRIDLIGQNGGTGEHYGHVLPRDTGPDNILTYLLKIAEALDATTEERVLYLTER